MAQSTLHTARLRLVPLAHEHLEHEVELDADPDVMRHLGNGRPRTREQVQDLHNRRMAASRRVAGLGFWVGFAAAEFVGWWILQPPEGVDDRRAAREAELGYRLLSRYWRQGFASEGARELIRHGFQELSLTRIFAETMAVNTASRATMTAVGLSHVRNFPWAYDEQIAGSELGLVEYAITRDEWWARAIRSPLPG